MQRPLTEVQSQEPPRQHTQNGTWSTTCARVSWSRAPCKRAEVLALSSEAAHTVKDGPLQAPSISGTGTGVLER
eukprot:8740493-Pyramimonas_sp.AAC.1